MISKVYFPRLVMTVSTVITSLVDFSDIQHFSCCTDDLVSLTPPP